MAFSFCTARAAMRHLVTGRIKGMDADGNITKSFKKSKQGKLKLVKNDDGTYRTVTSMDADYDYVKDELVEVFRMGEILVDHTFEDIRERAKIKQYELITNFY